MLTKQFTVEEIELLSHYELGVGRLGVMLHLKESLPYLDQLAGDIVSDLIDKLEAVPDGQFDAAVLPCAQQLAEQRKRLGIL